jgi:hypothetical protein
VALSLANSIPPRWQAQKQGAEDAVGEEEEWRDRSTVQEELALEVEEEAAEAAVVAPPALSWSLRPPFVFPFFLV